MIDIKMLNGVVGYGKQEDEIFRQVGGFWKVVWRKKYLKRVLYIGWVKFQEILVWGFVYVCLDVIVKI